MSLQRPKAIVFDWDNTLVDSWGVIREALNATFRDFGLAPWSLEDIQTRVAKSMRDSFPTLFGDEWERAGEVFYRHFEAIHLERLSPLPGAETALRELAEEGICLSVVSNKVGRLLRAEVDQLDWTRYFSAIVGAHDTANDKPAPDPVRLALKPGVYAGAEEVWFAGDSEIDLRCARNADCLRVLVREDPPREREFAGVEPALYFATAQSLSNLVKTL